MTVAYLGTGFHGFAPQPGVPTVGGALAEAISKVAGHGVEIVCAGRTDAGVHARGQVVHCDIDEKVSPEALAVSLNRMLAPSIVVRSCRVAPDGFDARRSALLRRYSYTLLNGPVPSPFLASVSWHVDSPLDLHAMMLAADPLIGEHDFSAFCRRPPDKHASDPLARRVVDARWDEVGDPLGVDRPGGGEEGARVLRFSITASAFCHQMVRSVVGTMVEMGKGRLRAGEMAAIIRSRNRAFAGPPAPPQGLILEEVIYPLDLAAVSPSPRSGSPLREPS